MSTPLIQGENITVTFGHGADAFDAVHKAEITGNAGEIIGIVGESGSGKTTLARVLIGLQLPASGEVLLEGERIFSSKKDHQLLNKDRWKLQMIFQDSYSSLNPRMRAWQTVAEAVQIWQKLPKNPAKEEAIRLLQSVGINEEQANLLPKSMSGGQRQRVSVARALAPNPKVLIADEPTSSIDQSAQAQLLNLLRKLQKERKLTIIFISHDLGLIHYLTSRVYIMNKGLIVECGETSSVFKHPEHPYTKLLLDSIPGHKREGCDVHLNNVKGEFI